MKQETKKIKVIGLGGIGKYLVEPLCRYLSHEYDEAHVTLIDGDSYEEKNRCRQRFSKLDNKAAVTVEELTPLFPNISFRAKKQYLDDDNVTGLIREGDIVFACVDNHATRKMISDRMEELEDGVLISGGNDFTDGNVILYRRVNGEDVGRPPTKMFPEIAEPTEPHPSELVDREGCEEQVDEQPQLLIMNNLIAARMLSIFYVVEHGNPTFEQVYDDLLTNRARPTPEPNIFSEEV